MKNERIDTVNFLVSRIKVTLDRKKKENTNHENIGLMLFETNVFPVYTRVYKKRFYT